MAVKPNAHPLLDALDAESYEWLEAHAPILLDAIEAEMANGMTPEELKRLVLRNVGPDRVALALRVEQAARALQQRGRA